MNAAAYLNASTIKEWVTNHFLETGKAADVATIATGIALSESTVRKVLAAAGGCIQGLACEQESRPSHDTNFGGVSGSHKVWTYRPSLETLRLLILAERSPR